MHFIWDSPFIYPALHPFKTGRLKPSASFDTGTHREKVPLLLPVLLLLHKQRAPHANPWIWYLTTVDSLRLLLVLPHMQRREPNLRENPYAWENKVCLLKIPHRRLQPIYTHVNTTVITEPNPNSAHLPHTIWVQKAYWNWRQKNVSFQIT